MCGYLNMEAADRHGAVAVIVRGVNTFEDMLNAEISSVSKMAKELGIEEGNTVRSIISKLG
jgi:uncharacterized protein YunC (DUF1805 family)